jgi:two-component system, OmpR family, phosphate regulon sensor histidine kinase PhoR
MKRRIFLYYVVLIIIGMSITGFFISEVAQKLYKNEVEVSLKNTALLIKQQILDKVDNNETVDYNKLALKYSEILNQTVITSTSKEKSNARITFINFDGKVLGESETNYLTMENHLNRKEVIAAISGKVGTDIRFSNTLKINFLYVALPLDSTKIVIRVAVPLVQLKEINKIIWYYTIIGILTGLILTVLLAIKFSASITNPIKELISISNEISNGNYSKKVNIKSKDEIGQLSHTFNDMAQKLKKTVADLTDKSIKVDSIMNSMISGIVAVDNKLNIILINAKAKEMFGIKNTQDVLGINILEVIRNHQVNTFLTETVENNVSHVNEVVINSPDEKVMMLYTNPIEPRKGEHKNLGGIIFVQDVTNIKKLEQIRTEFVSNVTHELKTPLTSIRGFIETLRVGAINDPDVAEKFLEIIDIEAERLYMLINDILHLSEIETKQKDINIATHDLKPIVEEVVSILQGAADKKNVILIDEVDMDIKITANRDRIKQMFINLIENGIKYNIDHGKVTIHATKSEGKIVFSVKDTGIGIAKEHLPRIFERFYRVDKGRSRNMGGTGLGLSIVKHIVNLYSGDIKVNSEPGEGTEFIIRLPM